MGWSSSSEICISSGHRIIRDVLNAIKDGVCVSQAEIIIESLAFREGGCCVARKRARECGADPTLFSMPSSGLNSPTSTSKCTSVQVESVVQCGLETGYILETIVYGAVLDPVALWVTLGIAAEISCGGEGSAARPLPLVWLARVQVVCFAHH